MISTLPHSPPQEPKYCEGLSRKIVRQTVTQLINGLEDEEEEGGGGGGGGAGALTPQSVTRAQCLATLLANYRCVNAVDGMDSIWVIVCIERMGVTSDVRITQPNHTQNPGATSCGAGRRRGRSSMCCAPSCASRASGPAGTGRTRYVGTRQ